MDESRKQFEEWRLANNEFANMAILSNGEYAEVTTNCAWHAWVASRAAIEIELPMPKYTWRSDDYSQGFDKGLAEQRKNDTDAIHAAGIKVKE